MVDPNTRSLFEPKSVAIVGASSNFEKASGYPLRNLINAKFPGKIFPVNPRVKDIAGVRCYESILGVPEVPDLAILMVDASLAPNVVNECGEKGVKAAIVGSGGFSELGEVGQKRQDDLVKIAKRYNIRLCGPNCHGVFNVTRNIPLGYNFSYALPLSPGPLAIASQSGALLGSLAARLFHADQGLSYVVSTGNEVDLDLCDYLEFFLDDEFTKVVALLIEGIPDGQRFISLADEAVRSEKAIVVLKVGKSERGVLTTMAHTSRMAGSGEVYDAVFRQYGIIATDTVEAFLTAARMVANQPAPQKGKLMVMTSTGAGASLMADKAAEYGIDLADISADTGAHIPPRRSAILANPFDTAGTSRTPGFLSTVCDAFASAPENDCLLLFLGPLAVRQEYATHFCKAATKYKKTAMGIMSLSEEEMVNIFKPYHIPVLDLSTDACFRVLRSLIQYGRFCAKRKKSVTENITHKTPPPNLNEFTMTALTGAMLTDSDVRKLLSYYGFKTPDYFTVATVSEATRAATELTFPVILKGLIPDTAHKHASGLVSRAVTNEDELARSYEVIQNNGSRHTNTATIKVIVEKYVDHEHEFILGVKYDPTFGPVVLFGLGGIFAEVLNDYSLRLAPTKTIDAEEMVSELKSFSYFREAVSNSGQAFGTLIESIQSISRMALDLRGKVAAIDINPIVFFSAANKAMVLDAKVHLPRL
jgi:acyl-CoA synthetase (NDP forming)